jgi:hypothetical protein
MFIIHIILQHSDIEQMEHCYNHLTDPFLCCQDMKNCSIAHILFSQRSYASFS